MKTKLLVLAVSIVLVALVGGWVYHRPDRARAASEEPAAAVGASDEPLQWRWSKEKASLAYSAKRYLPPGFELERVKDEEGYYTPINIRRKQDRKVIYSFKHRDESDVFTRWRDTLYIADYSPIANGCEVIAVDLKTGKQLWKSQLRGIGETSHSKYRNLVNIETDGKKLIVYGNEAHGRYVEHLDLRNGKTLANKKLDADATSLLGH